MSIDKFYDRDLEDLPPTLFEQEEERHRLVRADNEEREIRALIRSNRKLGYPEPKIGEKLHVRLDRSVPRRTRAGIKFERGQVMTLEIVDDGVDTEAVRKTGKLVVNRLEAERIFADDVLNVVSGPGGAAAQDAESLREENDALRAELEALRAQKSNRAQLDRERSARMAAEDKGDGRPSRLNAAREVRGDAPARDGVIDSTYEKAGATTSPETPAAKAAVAEPADAFGGAPKGTPKK